MLLVRWLSVFYLVFALTACNLEEITEIKTNTFETIIPLAGSDEPQDVMELKDGSYLVCGETSSLSQDKSKDAFLAKIGKTGKLIWIKNYGAALSQGANAVIEDRAGNFVFCGYTNTPVAGDVDLFVAKIDSDGNTVWDTTYAEAGGQYAVDLVELSDKQYLVAFNNNGKNSVEITTVNPNNGGRTSTKSFTGFYVSGMAYRSDNDIVLCGSGPSNSGNGTDGYLTKINAGGARQWENKFPDPDGNFLPLYGVSLAQDGGYFLCGSVLPPNTDHDFLLLGISPLGKEDWRKIPLSTLNADELTAIATARDESVVAAGYSSPNIYITKYTPDGAKVWENQIQPSGINTFFSINIKMTAATDGGFLIATALNNDIYLLKLNARGEGP